MLSATELAKIKDTQYTNSMPYLNYSDGILSADLRIAKDPMRYIMLKTFAVDYKALESYLISCVGASSILAMVGDSRTAGLDENNNPSITTPDISPQYQGAFLFQPGTTNDPATGAASNPQAFPEIQMSEAQFKSYNVSYSDKIKEVVGDRKFGMIKYGGRQLFLYGNHRPDERVKEFIRVVANRIRAGDSMAPAIARAIEHLGIFGVANMSLYQEDWRKYNASLKLPNEVLSEAQIPFYFKMTSCFYRFLVAQFEKYMPEEFALWAKGEGTEIYAKTRKESEGFKEADLSKIPLTYVDNQPKPAPSMLPWIAGAGLWALAFISKKRG